MRSQFPQFRLVAVVAAVSMSLYVCAISARAGVPDYVLKAVSVSTSAYRLDYVSGPATQPADQLHMDLVVVGQAATGTASDPVSGYRIELGFVPLLTLPPVNEIESQWVGPFLPSGLPRNWDSSTNWFPAGVPGNTKNLLYSVFIGPQPSPNTYTPFCRIRNISPTIKRLELKSGFELFVDSASSGLVTLSFDPPRDATLHSINDGIISVKAGAVNRTFTLQSAYLVQSPSAELRAGPSTGAGVSTLRLVDCAVENGVLRSAAGSIVRLFDSLLINVQTIGLIVDSDQTSQLQGSINNEQDISVRGTALEPSHLTATSADAVVSGNGRISLTDEVGSILGDSTGTLTNSAGHTIGGQGVIDGPVTNNGRISADAGGALRIQTTVTGVGQFEATSSGTLQFRPGASGNSVTNATLQVIDGGFDLDGDAPSNTPFTAEFTGNASFNDTILFQRGSTPPVSIGGRGRLSVRASVDVTGNGGQTFTFASGSLVQFGGDFINHHTAAASFDSDAATFQFYLPPGGSTVTQHFELAGQDRGANNPAGFTDNFAFGTVKIDAGRIVRFEDMFNNTSPTPCDETLYVHSLDIGAGAQVQIDCGRVYFENLVNPNGFTVTLSNGGRLIGYGIPGDINHSGAIDAADRTAFVSALLNGTAGNLDWYFRSDINGDGRTDGRDVQAFVQAAQGF